MKHILYSILFAVLPLPSLGQWEHFGGVYFAYPEQSHHYTNPPKGFTPFYISHFARHGSRWLPSDSRYEAVCQQFADTANLTELGRDVRRRLIAIYADAKGRGGDLTAIGALQHARMAERMFNTYPEVFANNAAIEARSSVVGRCVMSMNAFLVAMARLNPRLEITAEANKRYMDYIAYTSAEEKALEDSVQNKWTMQPARLILSLFKDTALLAANQRELASELHTIASDMQNVGIGISLYDIFTEQEMRQIYDMNNERMHLCNGIDRANRWVPQRCALSLWRNIVESADSAIAKGAPAATLRFGHDTSLYRLLSFLGLYANERRMDVIIPMGANLQMVFYRNDKGSVLVKVLHNEREVLLPVESSTAPYYDWSAVKRFYDNEIVRIGGQARRQ